MKFSIILLSLLIAYSLSINANRLKKKTTSNDAYTIMINSTKKDRDINNIVGIYINPDLAE